MQTNSWCWDLDAGWEGGGRDALCSVAIESPARQERVHLGDLGDIGVRPIILNFSERIMAMVGGETQ